jgi:hypothetical protein
MQSRENHVARRIEAGGQGGGANVNEPGRPQSRQRSRGGGTGAERDRPLRRYTTANDCDAQRERACNDGGGLRFD